MSLCSRAFCSEWSVTPETGAPLCAKHLREEQRELDAAIHRADDALKRLEQRQAPAKESP